MTMSDLLTSCVDDIDLQLVCHDRHAPQRGHGVHGQQRPVRVTEGTQALQGLHHAGARLPVGHEHQVWLVFLWGEGWRGRRSWTTP